VVGLKRGPFSLVNTTEQLLERKSNSSGLENQEYGHRDPSLWPRDTLYPQKLELTSPTSGGRSVGIAGSQTKATELVLFVCLFMRDCIVGCIVSLIACSMATPMLAAVAWPQTSVACCPDGSVSHCHYFP
jgi:hypothetical protein